MEIVQKVIGVLLIAAGAFLSYTAFERAQAVIVEPQQITPWLELRAAIHEPAQPEEKKSFFKINAAPSVFSDKQIYAMGGYVALLLGILAMGMLAYIGVAFLKGGVHILLDGRTGTKSKK